MFCTIGVQYILTMSHSDFPITMAWYKGLGPAGLEAFPSCTASTRLPMSIAARHPELSGLPMLIPQWRRALAMPMQEGGWMPETTLVLQFMLLREAFYIDDASYLTDTKARLKASFLHPAIRPLMALMSPHLLILGAGRRWGAYHQGTTLSVASKWAGSFTGVLNFPPGLYPSLMIKDTQVAIETSIEMTGKRIVSMTAEVTEPGVCALAGAWE